jgi:hypothetical protein
MTRRSPPSRTAERRARGDEPPPDLHEIVRRVARLRPCWQQPEWFFEARSDLVHDLRRLAHQGDQEARGRAIDPSPRERRLETLARVQAAEIGRLRQMLAEACRPPRRRRVPDHRQLALAI